MLLVIRKHTEAAAMTQWGVRIARALGTPLHVLWLEHGEGPKEASDLTWQDWSAEVVEKDAHWKHVEPALREIEGVEVKACRAYCISRHETVLSIERSMSPDLIVVGRHDSAKDGSMTGKLAREILDDAHSAVLVVRLGSFAIDDQLDASILVPCAGGDHSRIGIRMASKIAGQDATAFYVESDTDDLSLDVGHEHLRRAISRAGISASDVTSKVVLSNNFSDALKDEVEQGKYGLLLIGAAGGGTLRRKLFGTVPERLIKGDDSMSVGVIRAARPVGRRLREKFAQLLQLNVPQMEREERVELFAEVEGKARWSFDFAVLMILSTAIAALGLLADSPAVVIGAMLVAPLMTPLLGGGLALVQGNLPLWRSSQNAVLGGFLLALLVSIILGLGARWIDIGLTNELLARGEPTLLDLGVAFFSGIAASYCLSRPKLSSALAGVAIAAALVPPIATTGITLAMGEHSTAKGAGLLFGTNVVAIVLGAAVNFYVAGVRGKQGSSQSWAHRLAIVLALVCVVLIAPLTSVLVGKGGKDDSMAESVKEVMISSVGGDEYKFISATIVREDGKASWVEVHLEGPEFPSDAMTEKLSCAVQEKYGEDMKTKIRMTLVKGL